MATKSRKVTTKMKKIALGNKNAPIALSNVFGVCVSVLLYRTNDAKQMRGGEKGYVGRYSDGIIALTIHLD